VGCKLFNSISYAFLAQSVAVVDPGTSALLKVASCFCSFYGVAAANLGKHIIMPLSPGSFSESIVFWGRPFTAFIVCLFVCPDSSCYHDISWTAWAISMKLTGNIH